MKSNFYFLLALTILVFACRKNPGENLPPKSSEKEIISFSLPDSLNPSLSQTINGVVTEGEIKLAIPSVVNAAGLIASFQFKGESLYVGTMKQESGVTVNDFTKELIYTVKAEDGSEKKYTVKTEWLPELKNAVPHIYIVTDNSAPIVSKKDYVKGSIRIDGGGEYENYEGRMSIRGRGNTTWFEYPKKPYRIKLDQISEMLGLSAEKDWVLLANYIDESLMCNAVAMKIGRLLELPFTHHIIPVDVTINGEYMGNYMFTEHKEVEENRINVGEGGVLLEFDTNFDEEYEFYSKNYSLPVMIQYPELDKLDAGAATVEFEKIKSDFETFEQAVADASFPANYLNYFDNATLVNYMIVYTLTLNEEINHPKSTYLYKLKGGKYSMGPIWDFDWGFGYEGTAQHFIDPARPLFWSGAKTSKGTVFFQKLMQDPATKALFKQEWNKFKADKYPKLVTYIREYADIIKDSYTRNFQKWPRGNRDIEADLQRLLTWLDQRAAYMDAVTW